MSVTSEDGLLGYKDERILSYMVSEAALRFLVLHEIGHHVRGHISDLAKSKNFVLLKVIVHILMFYSKDRFVVTIIY